MNFRPLSIFALGVLSALSSNPGWGAPPQAPAGTAEARIVKAAYVYNFTKFVEWVTEEGQQDSTQPFIICILGDDPIGNALDRIPSLQAPGRPIRVLHARTSEDIPLCHILYVGTSEEPLLPRILAKVECASVLTVSDIPRFAERGGMIGFVQDRNRVRIEINALRIRTAGLVLSSKLLEIACLVPGGAL